MNVNHNAPSGPAVIAVGSELTPVLAGKRTTSPAVVMRPTANACVNHSAASGPEPSDRVSPDHGEPEGAVWTRRDAKGARAIRLRIERQGKLGDLTLGGDAADELVPHRGRAPRIVAARQGEPYRPVRAGSELPHVGAVTWDQEAVDVRRLGERGPGRHEGADQRPEHDG